MAKHGTGGQVKTRLYLEGRLVENGLTKVQVQGNVNGPATAQLELTPTDSIKHILPLTWVHVFTTDPLDLEPKGDLSDYKLLFEGVVVGRGPTRSADGRSFVVTCAGPEIFWVEARQFWLNIASSNGGIVDQIAVQTSGGYGRFGTVAATGAFGWLSSSLAVEKDQGEERFLDTLISVLDDIGNVNPFYTNMRNRFRITDRIIRGPAGKTEKLFQLALLSDFLDGLAGRQSGQSNLAEVVNQLLGAIMHEWVSIVAPPCVKARIFDRDTFGNIKRTPQKVTRPDPDGSGSLKVDLYEFQTAEEEIVASSLFKPDVYTLSPPSCNVLFPNMYDQLSMHEDFMAETTRLQMKPQLPLINNKVLQGLFLLRPSELEVYTALIRDPAHGTAAKRTPDGKYADGKGQTPTFHDYDWSTNEERIKGIVYNFMNLAPGPSAITLSDPGKRDPSGTRKGGIPEYLQNVASYEWFKSKYASRQTSLAGIYNMRAVAGLPLLALDDSAAEMNIIASCVSVTHSVSSDGSASTQYGIQLPRLVNEVDYNRPKFKGSSTVGEIDFDLFRDESGKYDFGAVFDGKNRPPIPEWFDASYRTLTGLDLRYREWFGDNCRVVESIVFVDPTEAETDALLDQKAQREAALAAAGIDALSGADVTDVLPSELRDSIQRANDQIDLSDAVAELVGRYRLARLNGREFEESSSFTARAFTRIDQAFRFIGAAPLELADPVKAGIQKFASALSDVALGKAPPVATGPRFDKTPAKSRAIDFRNARLDFFVGDTSPGSGYAAEASQTKAPPASSSTTTSGSGVDVDAVSGATPPPPGDRMSGAFPVFDTRIHTGSDATDAKARDALLRAKGEREPSTYARYDGRPMMFDFEFRLWQESLKAAGYSPTSEKIEDSSLVATYYKTDGGGTRPATAEEQAAGVQKLKETQEKRKKEEEARAKKGRSRTKRVKTISANDQAPTGAGLDQGQRMPLPQPLSEKQVVDLRRAIVDAYREELAKSRGFTG